MKPIIGNTELSRLYEYWLTKSSPVRLPSRQDIKPFELPSPVLPHVMLLDLERAGDSLRIRFRLTGTHIDEALGRNPTGEIVSDGTVANGRYVAYIQALYEEIVWSGEPIYSENIFQLAGQSVPMLTKRLSLPLSSDGKTVDMALVGAVFEYPLTSTARYSNALQDFSETLRRRLNR